MATVAQARPQETPEEREARKARRRAKKEAKRKRKEAEAAAARAEAAAKGKDEEKEDATLPRPKLEDMPVVKARSNQPTHWSAGVVPHSKAKETPSELAFGSRASRFSDDPLAVS